MGAEKDGWAFESATSREAWPGSPFRLASGDGHKSSPNPEPASLSMVPVPIDNMVHKYMYHTFQILDNDNLSENTNRHEPERQWEAKEKRGGGEAKETTLQCWGLDTVAFISRQTKP